MNHTFKEQLLFVTGKNEVMLNDLILSTYLVSINIRRYTFIENTKISDTLSMNTYVFVYPN